MQALESVMSCQIRFHSIRQISLNRKSSVQRVATRMFIFLCARDGRVHRTESQALVAAGHRAFFSAMFLPNGYFSWLLGASP